MATALAATGLTYFLMQVLERHGVWSKLIYIIAVVLLSWGVVMAWQMQPPWFDSLPFENKEYRLLPAVFLSMFVVWNGAYGVVLVWEGIRAAMVSFFTAK